MFSLFLSLSLFLLSIPSLCSLLFFSLSHRRYRGHVDAAEQGGGEEDDEEEDYEDEEEAALAREERRLLRRLDAGLYTLQRIVLVMASILVQSGKVRHSSTAKAACCVCVVCVCLCLYSGTTGFDIVVPVYYWSMLCPLLRELFLLCTRVSW